MSDRIKSHLPRAYVLRIFLQEFYSLRAEITKYLIKNRGFQVVLCEADWPFMYHINDYIQRKKVTMYPKGPKGVRFPQWMWKNKGACQRVESWQSRQL